METITSKKFIVFITCTGLLVRGYLTPELYLPVALALLGVETAMDMRGTLRRKFGEPDETPPES